MYIPQAYALEGVVINEIAWMGSEVPNIDQKQWWRYEWLELYNPTNEDISLNGWKIEMSRDTLDFSIPLSGIIPPLGYVLVASSDKIPNADISYQNFSGKFTNSGQRILLKDNTGKIVDDIDARTGWPAGDNESKSTMERTTQGWQTSFVAGGTPRARNSMIERIAKTEKDPSSKNSGSFPDTGSRSLVTASLVAGLSVLAVQALKSRLQAR